MVLKVQSHAFECIDQKESHVKGGRIEQLVLLLIYLHYNAMVFIYLDKREVLQQEYSPPSQYLPLLTSGG